MDVVDFADPPVVETVLSVGFAPVEGLTSAHVGHFWTEVSESFPTAQERLPYDMPIERFVDQPAMSLELGFGEVAPRTRLWLISDDDQRLLQIQRDWFAYNWRVRAHGRYSDARFPERRMAFDQFFAKFMDYVSRQRLGDVSPRQCEVTYINHVPSSGAATDDLGEILGFVSKPRLTELAGRFESWQTTFSVLLSEDNQPVGRLHISAQPIAADRSWVWQLNLTARGRPIGSGREGVLRFMDLGHEAIVTNFREITTERMHEAWGMKDGRLT